MKVILLQDVAKIGKKFEVKEVAEGYARNFLLARNLAKPATSEALEWLQMQKEILFKMFATCHGVYIIENEKCGDQLDVSMEEFSGWEMKNSENPNIKFTSNY